MGALVQRPICFWFMFIYCLFGLLQTLPPLFLLIDVRRIMMGDCTWTSLLQSVRDYRKKNAFQI